MKVIKSPYIFKTKINDFFLGFEFILAYMSRRKLEITLNKLRINWASM